MNNAQRRIAEINGTIRRQTLTEGVTLPTMITKLRECRAQLLDQKRVSEGETNDYLAKAVNGLSDTIGALQELIDWRNDIDWRNNQKRKTGSAYPAMRGFNNRHED